MSETKVSKANIKNNKMLILTIILAVIGVILLLWNGDTNTGIKTSNPNERLEMYRSDVERKIADLCSSVSGVSSVKVSVYFTTGFETVYAYNEQSKETSSGTNSEKKYVTIGSGNDESMVCVVEKMPNICGVAIVCKGGGNPLIANQLINLISSAYNVPKNKIYVAEGKK